MWKKADFAAHEHNVLVGCKDRTDWHPFLPDFIPIYKGQEWDEEKQIVIDPLYSPNLLEASLCTFLEKAQRFFSEFDGKKIVQ